MCPRRAGNNARPRAGSVPEPSERAAQLRFGAPGIPSPVGQDHPLRMPRHDPREIFAGTLLAADPREAHVERRLAVGIQHAAEPGQPAHAARQFRDLEVLDQVGEDQRGAGAVEEHELLQRAAAAKAKLLDFRVPRGGGGIGEVRIEGDVDALRCRPLAHPRRRPRGGAGITLLPGRDRGVVDLVGRHQVPHRAEGVDRRGQAGVRRDRRVAPQAAIAQPHHRHARRKGHAGPERCSHPDDGPVDDPDPWRDRLQRVDRLVQADVRHCPIRRYRQAWRPRSPARKRT